MRRPVSRRGRLHGARGGRRRDRRRQRELEQPVEIADAQRAEHQDRHAHAGPPKDDALFDVGAGQHRRARLLERERHARRAMAVGVGLDDGDDAGDVGGRRCECRGSPRAARSRRTELLNRARSSDLQRARDRRAQRCFESHYAPCARFAKRVCSRRNARRTTPVGPLRCLARISSAVPGIRIVRIRLYTSSR